MDLEYLISMLSQMGLEHNMEEVRIPISAIVNLSGSITNSFFRNVSIDIDMNRLKVFRYWQPMLDPSSVLNSLIINHKQANQQMSNSNIDEDDDEDEDEDYNTIELDEENEENEENEDDTTIIDVDSEVIESSPVIKLNNFLENNYVDKDGNKTPVYYANNADLKSDNLVYNEDNLKVEYYQDINLLEIIGTNKSERKQLIDKGWK